MTTVFLLCRHDRSVQFFHRLHLILTSSVSGVEEYHQGSHASWKVLDFFFKIPWPGKSWKNILENYTLRHFCSELWHLKLHQISDFPGLYPRPCWGSLKHSPDPLAGGDGDCCTAVSPTTLPRYRPFGLFFFLSICGLRKGPGKFLMRVLEKSWIFLSVKEWEPWLSRHGVYFSLPLFAFWHCIMYYYHSVVFIRD